MEDWRIPAPEYTEQELIRREKLNKYREAGQDPFTITKFDRTHHSTDISARFEELEGKTVTIAGRMMSRRIMGKASFMHLLDGEGEIQVYVRRDDVGQEVYQDFKTMDIGDILGIEGFVFKTQTGEISVHAQSLTLLSKSLKVLPEKWNGLKDQDLRYRQRYVDTIVNPEVKNTFIKRSQIINALREFLDSKGFLEVDTPVLQTVEIGANSRSFITHHNALDIPMYLRIETELYLKRLIVGGFEKVYEVGRIFRNEGMDTRHNPEFTTIEVYQAYADYNDVMNLVEEMYVYVANKVCGTTKIQYQGKEIDMTSPWTRMTMAEAVKKYSGLDYYDWKSDEEAREACKARGVHVEEKAVKGECLEACFDEFVEANLIQPTFITDYPVAISPLAKRKKDEPDMTERFEYFCNGSELGNAFSELNDPVDQRERFVLQAEAKRRAGGHADLDEDFISALEFGMPPTGGLGFGVDRLVMLLTDSASIRDVLLFPTMKPIGKGSVSAAADAAPAPAAETAAAQLPPETEEKIDFSNVVIEPLFEDQVDFETFSKSDFRAVKVLECEAVPKSKKLLKFLLDDGSGVNRIILSGIHAYYEPEELIGKTCIAITNLPPRKMMGIDSCGMLISAVHKEGDEEKLHLLMVDPHIPAGAKLY
ncbi:MAG: lysine--tRNA ligase [Clostridia bacterium]|nr:lysine--tRNA ligase [Clostridia bacterium]